MNIGITVDNLGNIEEAKKAGFEYIVLPGTFLFVASEKEIQGLRKKLQSVNVASKTINRYCPQDIKMAGDGYSPDKAREYAKVLSAKCAETGCESVGIGSPLSRRIDGNISFVEALKQISEFVSITADEFRKYHIVTCIEPLSFQFCNLINSLKEAEEIINSIDADDVKMIADLYNIALDGLTDNNTADFINDIYHVHVSDDEGSVWKRSWLKPEKKGIYENEIRHLISNGYKGDITLEIDVPFDFEKASESAKMLKDIVTMKGGRPCI